MSKRKFGWQALGTIIVVVCAILGVIAVWPQISTVVGGLANKPVAQSSGLTCNSTVISQQYTTTLYSAQKSFCITNGQSVAKNFSVSNYNNYGYDISLNGSYTSTAPTQLYVLNAVQYGEFLIEKNKISNYTWYSGEVQAANINLKNLDAGQTYYVVFYTNSSTSDYITIGQAIQYNYN